jgi:hypothetical protein
MHLRPVRSFLIAALTVLSVASLGFLFGHGPVVRDETAREVTSAVGSLYYASASNWRPAAWAPTVPGISIDQPIVLAPDGNGSQEGLVIGRLGGDSHDPLPASFLARQRQPPSTAVVYLLNTEAYRYSQMSVSGYDRALTLYTVPGGPSKAIIACYSPLPDSNYLRECERVASTFTPAVGGITKLVPDAEYARQIRAAVERVDVLRSGLQSRIRPYATRASVRQLASDLARGVAVVAGSLSSVQPPSTAEGAHASLVESLWRSRDAYSAFAAAVDSGRPLEYAAARAEVDEAEARVNAALEHFALLGYS